jgi:hypothetical protein
MDEMLPSKDAVRQALSAALREAMATMAHSAKDAAEGATHEENRAEGDKDMRSTEDSYIARGKAIRTAELAEDLARTEQLPLRRFSEGDPIGVGALVRVFVEERPRVFFLSSHGGGYELSVGRCVVTVVTPASPVGRALLGRRHGDSFELPIKGVMIEWVVDAIA